MSPGKFLTAGIQFGERHFHVARLYERGSVTLESCFLKWWLSTLAKSIWEKILKWTMVLMKMICVVELAPHSFRTGKSCFPSPDAAHLFVVISMGSLCSFTSSKGFHPCSIRPVRGSVRNVKQPRRWTIPAWLWSAFSALSKLFQINTNGLNTGLFSTS